MCIRRPGWKREDEKLQTWAGYASHKALQLGIVVHTANHSRDEGRVVNLKLAKIKLDLEARRFLWKA